MQIAAHHCVVKDARCLPFALSRAFDTVAARRGAVLAGASCDFWLKSLDYRQPAQVFCVEGPAVYPREGVRYAF